MKTLQSLLAVVFLAGTAVSSPGDVTPLSSSIRVGAESNAGASPAENVVTDPQTTTLDPLSDSITAQAVNGDLSATVESDVAASWTSSSAGVFSINNSFATSNLSQYASAQVAVASSSWTYSIVSDVAATLTLNYSVTYMGPYPRSADLNFEAFQGPTANLFEWPVVESTSISGSGTVQVALDANTDYSFLLFDNSNVNQNLPAFNSSMNSDYSFEITPVPEPNTVALAGLSAAALWLWRRRK